MNLSSLLNKVFPVSLNRYYLEVPDCVFQTDVEEFDAEENLSELYRYTIKFTSDESDIKPQQMLRKNVWLHMQDTPGILDKVLPGITRKTVHGIVTGFRRLQGSADQVLYEIEIKPFISLLEKQFRSHRFFVNKSVPEVVAQILAEHGLAGWQYQFTLKKDYPKREQINQYQESDLTFIQRLLAEVGIFYYFRVQEDARTEVIHFGDSQAAFEAGKTLPLSSPSGMGDGGTDSIWGLSQHHQVVQAGVTAKDYNHREAQYILRSVEADMTRGDGDETNYGKVYNYRARHPQSGDKYDPSAETANFYARLDHERFLASQTLITGASTDPCLAAGQVITVTDTNFPPSLPELFLNPLILVRLGFIASRKSAMRVLIGAVPYSETICWRPELLERPKVSGTMTARITSAKDNDIYAWQDASGLYRVVFDADEERKDRGQESMPVRLAKPYGGDMYGFHFPLIQGTEVAIAFREGDPDQPYIAHALHDSRHVDHVTEKNSTRNVIRTAGLNKLRMEDKRGEEHIKLSTEYAGKTQLNLGHNVDDDRLLRGEGAELRTDDWVAVRGGKGVFISADAQQSAQGRMMDMEEAIRQLKNALSLAKSLNEIAQKAEATQGDSDSHEELNNALEDLKQAGILAHAPEGIGIVSPKSVRMASGGASVGLMSGKNTDISAGESITLAATKTVSVFAQGEGMQLIAGAGKLDIQAQKGELNAAAQQDITISSAEGKVTVSASQELTITCGGAYIKLSGGNIEIGAPGNILLKCANAQKMGPATLDSPPHTFPKGYGEGFTLKDLESGEIQPFTFYRVTTGEGEVYEGVSDEHGKTMRIFTAMPSALKIEFPDEEMTDIKEEK
ncbi:type VI secretion system Vgr family protein [Pantoea sp. SOD02]|uniref:type VI secretion system Vgr family protein n=1 Tax=Pantoea sp. SOD02 TaxID=2970818 RepID=UPI002157089B|nr:type VI secretion system Vgr family protein [Pantoea sp. SOD02]UVC28865.1 type VI secretion system tip protein VgrG [Pantoea sp. SOD02]